MNIVEVKQLNKSFERVSFFGTRKSVLHAVKEVSFDVKPCEIFGIVGESGSGKSTVARLLVGLYKPESGQILIDGDNVLDARIDRVSKATKIQMIFQDPNGSFNPRMRVAELLEEPLRLLYSSKDDFKSKIDRVLADVGLDTNAKDKFPHQFSGGQKQRLAIARALLVEPKVLIADEAVSALDVSVQAQILELLLKLRKSHSLTIIFISHDLAVVHYLCDRVAVMQKGEIVELATKNELFKAPQSAYTKKLLNSLPELA